MVQITISEGVACSLRWPDRRIHTDVSNLQLQEMDALSLTPERLAQLEEFARRRGQGTADALDDVLASYLEWKCQDYQEALDAVHQGHGDVKARRTMPDDQFSTSSRVNITFRVELSDRRDATSVSL